MHKTRALLTVASNNMLIALLGHLIAIIIKFFLRNVAWKKQSTLLSLVACSSIVTNILKLLKLKVNTVKPLLTSPKN